jgi:hypothetical protein
MLTGETEADATAESLAGRCPSGLAIKRIAGTNAARHTKETMSFNTAPYRKSSLDSKMLIDGFAMGPSNRNRKAAQPPASASGHLLV